MPSADEKDNGHVRADAVTIQVTGSQYRIFDFGGAEAVSLLSCVTRKTLARWSSTRRLVSSRIHVPRLSQQPHFFENKPPAPAK